MVGIIRNIRYGTYLDYKVKVAQLIIRGHRGIRPHYNVITNLCQYVQVFAYRQAQDVLSCW